MPALTKSSNKKRTAATQSGPSKAKKVHVEKPEKAEKKRSQPVTAPPRHTVAEDSGSDSDEDQGEWGGVDEADEGEEYVADAMDEDAPDSAPAISTKDPNANRQSHKEQKLVHQQRKAAKPHSNLIGDAKRVWALARQTNIPMSERKKHIQELMDIIRGHVKDIVLKHDASRIVQTVIKHGGQKERDEVAIELKGKYRELAQNKYSKFLVTKLIRLCPAHRASILQEFQSHVLRLLLHREATSVLADAFELYANAYERTILLRDFYGKETVLFTTTFGTDAEKERARKGLRGVLEGVDPERRRRVLSALKENLVQIFNNSDKGAVTHAVVHRALWEYLTALNDIEDRAECETLQREIFETCQDVLAEMVHTKDGSRVVREFLAMGTAKDRKQVLKVLKPHVERMCLDDEAQLVLFTALDVIDDTKMASKSLISEMTAPATKLYTSPQGRRSLIYLLVPRTRRHFTPAQIASLAETDETRSRTSKKDASTRENEVRKFASDSLISWVEANAPSIVREPGGSLVVGEIMLYADGDKTGAQTALLDAISSDYPASDPAALHLIDLPHASRLYKTLLQGGHFNRTKGEVERALGWDASTFAVAFIGGAGKDLLVAICVQGECNGAFVVAELCEALIIGGKDKERGLLRGWFDSGVRKTVEQGNAKGKKVLLESLRRL